MKGSALVLFTYLFQAAQAGIFSQRASKDGSGQDAAVQDDIKPATQRLDYKLSFKQPLYYNTEIPFWATKGDVIKATDRVRLASSVAGQKGGIWSEYPVHYDEWQVDMQFAVSGSNIHGGRGLAFWYSKDRMTEGPIFGAKDAWDGLSIWFDSANPKTHTPTVMGFLNDGAFSFASAGVDPSKRMFGMCQMDYRNAPNNVYFRLSYKDHTLTLLLDTTSQGMNYRPCFQQHAVMLPKGYYFGVTAASHNPADDHDVMSFETYELNPPVRTVHKQRPMEEEMTKRGETFTELTEEQRKKIEEAEFEVRRLRDEAEDSENSIKETAATLGVIYDTQQRTLENVYIAQLQLEALGAPNPDKALQHDFSKPLDEQRKQQDAPPLNSLSLDQLKTEAAAIVTRLEQQSTRYDEQMQALQDTMGRVELLIQSLDKRVTLQSSNIHGKLTEITKESAEAKGTLSTLIKYILYAVGLQATVGLAVYIYWKVRVERNDKKFL
ncbi:legume-like lectin family-domain-containing protein [Gongronella butleri]|nr:legume-like lectin family-domain-containing protein [Gongronella butleri]